MTTYHMDPKEFFPQGIYLDAATEICKKRDDRLQLALDSIEDVNRLSPQGATLLIYAIFQVNRPAVDALLSRGADANLAASNGITPLKAAAMIGSQEILRILLEKNANPNVADDDGFTPLHFATQQAIIETERCSLETETTSRIEMLLRFGAHVDSQNNFGITPLMMACEMGGKACATILLRAGADPDRTDLTGLTARSLARPWGFQQIFADWDASHKEKS